MDNLTKSGEYSELLTVSPSPHIKHPDTTRSIMICVLIALLPATVWSVMTFGFRSLTLSAVSVIACMLFEFLYQLLLKKPITVLDFSAAVTGLLVALNLPSTAPLWMPIVAAFFAIIIVKQLFGGIGKNIVNPALAARVFLFSWTGHMSDFNAPGTTPDPFKIMLSTEEVDAIASATPLASLKSGILPDVTVADMFVGFKAGCLGEVSAMLLIAGGIFLLLKKVITWHIPVTFMATVYLVSLIFPAGGANPFDFAIYQLLSGGVMIGAIFMATDYATSPVTNTGRMVFGIGCGLLTVFIRRFGGYPDGVSFAILIMNLLVWYIDKFTKPVKFGGINNGKKE